MSLHPGTRDARLTLRILTTAVALALGGTLLQAPPAAAAKSRPAISLRFFGVHHMGLLAEGAVGWPQAPVGSVRLWDNGVSWRDLEVAPGVFDWTRVDALMAKARANGATVLLVLGQTPVFHSTQPDVPSWYGPGAAAMPTNTAWVNYVRAVAERNRTVWGGVADFQVWNEANVIGFWAGTPRQMAQLTEWTDAALRSVDPSATLVAPALVTRLSGQRAWVKAFYKQKVRRKNVSEYVDALSLQLYPLAGGTPEASMELLSAVRAVLRRYRVSKPIWNTEVNYGLVGGPQNGTLARPLPAAGQVGNVIRTYVLNAQNGVSRVYWYAWDLLGMSNTPMVAEDRVTLTPAGQAYVTVRSWLLGTRPAGCTVARNKTYTCTFRSGRKVLRVVWNPKRSLPYVLPRGTRTFVTSDGDASSAKDRKRLRVGPVPVLLRGSR
ncbi:MAG: hypothetical protein ACRDWY_13340 [Actinomycetes bacterium]